MSTRAFPILTVLALGLAACGGHETKETPAARPRSDPGRDHRSRSCAWARRARWRCRAPSAPDSAPPSRPAYPPRWPSCPCRWASGWRPARSSSGWTTPPCVRPWPRPRPASRRPRPTWTARRRFSRRTRRPPRELDQMTARTAGAEAQVTAARDSLSYAVLRAPFAGRVAARPVNLGDVVNPGMTLVEIEGRGRARGPGQRGVADRGPPASRARRSGPCATGRRSPSRRRSPPSPRPGDPTTHRVEVKAAVPSAPGCGRAPSPDSWCPRPPARPASASRSSAVFPRGGLNGLFVADDGTARLRWVALGERDGDTVEIRAGLEAGERVVLDPDRPRGRRADPRDEAASDAGSAPAEER